MTRDKSSSVPQLPQLIEQAKSVRPISQATRARVLRRARTSMLLGASVAPSNAPWPRTRASAVTWLGGAAVAVGLAGAGIALHLHQPQIPAMAPATSPASSAVAVGSRLEPAPSSRVFPGEPESAAPATSTAEAANDSRPAPIVESYAAELVLLRRAQAAYGRHDFAVALQLLAEHGRRFPNGRLAEEREALRVRALSASGLNQAARVAAHAFAARFPHSVLLSRTMATAGGGD